MNKGQQIREIQNIICNNCGNIDGCSISCKAHKSLAQAIYLAGYRKINEYEAVNEFAEKLKKIVFEQGNPYNVPYEEFSQANILFMVIDELLKDYLDE